MAKFGERYELIRRIGAGGMGEVWLAHDEQLASRPVAIKIMHQHMLPNADDVARFEREMRFAAMMDHPNIVTVYTTGTCDDAPFMVMEYLRGHDLEKALPGGDAERIAGIGRDICSALAYAHRKGVLHRDIKPSNLFLCESGQVKITDFGVARAVGGTTLSTAGVLVGTFAYLPPERWRGEPPAFSNDIWAVGCVLYRLISGGCRGCSPTPPTTRSRRCATTRSPTCATSATRPTGSPARSWPCSPSTPPSGPPRANAPSCSPAAQSSAPVTVGPARVSSPTTARPGQGRSPARRAAKNRRPRWCRNRLPRGRPPPARGARAASSPPSAARLVLLARRIGHRVAAQRLAAGHGHSPRSSAVTTPPASQAAANAPAAAASASRSSAAAAAAAGLHGPAPPTRRARPPAPRRSRPRPREFPRRVADGHPHGQSHGQRAALKHAARWWRSPTWSGMTFAKATQVLESRGFTVTGKHTRTGQVVTRTNPSGTAPAGSTIIVVY